MKRKTFFILLILSIFTLISISCVSKPPIPLPDTNKPPDINLAKIKADKARNQAMDFDANTYFPTEWADAEKQYSSGTDSGYNAAADAYNDLFKKAVPLYAQAKEDEMMAVRAELIATGFTDAFPQYLKTADDLALAAKAKYDARDFYGAKDAASTAMNEYQTLLTGAKTYVTRQEIINRGFANYDSDNFLKADETAKAALDAYNAGDKKTALANAEEAQLRYNLVLSNGWTTYSSERMEAASKERELAVAEKANIACRDTFRKGDALLDEAKALYADGKYSEAALAFVDAEANFAISRKETEDKRKKAEDAIRMAGDKIGESNVTAIEAEKIIEGGSR